MKFKTLLEEIQTKKNKEFLNNMYTTLKNMNASILDKQATTADIRSWVLEIDDLDLPEFTELAELADMTVNDLHEFLVDVEMHAAGLSKLIQHKK